MQAVQLFHGGGSRETAELIKSVFFKAFGNELLASQEDAALLSVGKKIAFSTDSFVVSPRFFPGGDIGKLAIAGTCNDLAMMGAKPLYLSAGFIIEEGFLLSDLKKIAASMAQELRLAGAQIVTGDTKVVPKGVCDGIFINTSGIGEVLYENLGARELCDGDAILLSRDIGCHSSCIMALREELDLSAPIQSDCKSLWQEVSALLGAGLELHAMRDATRGGLSAVLNEWSAVAKKQIVIEENACVISDAVSGFCEMLGFDPFDLANEGTFVLATAPKDAKKALEILQGFNKNAAIIGSVSKGKGVVLKNAYGSSRFLDFPKGELLPRIC